MGSYIQARTLEGKWLLRIENIDPPREQAGATDNILHTLEQFGFEWDDSVIYQSKHTERYEAALAHLKQQALTYHCQCSRKTIAQSAKQGCIGYIYPGTCRHARHNKGAIRLITPDHTISFQDSVQQDIKQNLAKEVGDFVLKRADGLFAYQLAVVVDDAAQGITDVVRGYDLFDLTPAQIYLQNCLNLPHLNYAHLPVVVNKQKQKLSKQTGASALDVKNASALLYKCLRLLNQNPPNELQRWDINSIWLWARENWRMKNIPATPEFPYQSN